VYTSTAGSDYLVVVTQTSVQVWSASIHRIKLGELVRDEPSLQQYGVNRRAWWSPSKRTIVIATDDSVLLFFGLNFSKSEMSTEWEIKDDAGVPAGNLRAVGIYLQNSIDLREPSQELQHMLSKMYRAPIADMVGDSRALFVALENGVLLSFSWSAQIFPVPKEPPLPDTLPPHRDPPVSVRSLTIFSSSYASFRLIAVVLTDGTVSLMSTPPEAGISLISGNCIYPPNRQTAVTAAFHPGGTSLAIGLANGQVILYSFQGTPSKTAPSTLQSLLSPAAWQPTVTLSLSEWGYTSEMVGSVGCLEWSPDGVVLAVGYARAKGLAVWTQSGCRVMSTTSHRIVSSDDNANCASLSPHHDIGTVATLAWLPYGYGLLATDVEAPSSMCEICFVRMVQRHHRVGRDLGPGTGQWMEGNSDEMPSRVSLSPSKWNFAVSTTKSLTGAAADTDTFFLQGADRIVMISDHLSRPVIAGDRQWTHKMGRNNGNGAKASKESPPMPFELKVRHVSPPRSYVQSAFPLLHMAISMDGCHVAVAGTCGMALYSRLEDRWRLFGDANQEKQIKCGAFSWLFPGNFIASIVSSSPSFKGLAVPLGDVTGRTDNGMSQQSTRHTLIIFPRHHLDLSSALVKYPLSQVPAAMDSLGQSIILLNTRPMEQGLDIEVLNVLVSKAEISVTRRLSLIGLANVLLEATLLAPRPSYREVDPEHCILFREGGLLSVLNRRDGTELLLSRGVEAYWVPSNPEAMTGLEMEMPMWTYGASGMTLLFPPFNQLDHDRLGPAPPMLTRASPSVGKPTATNDPELEFDPDVYPVGISMSHLSIVGVMQRTVHTGFYIQPESQPVLPCLLRRLLEQGRSNEAVRLATAHSGDASNFSRSLEWLLFTALESNDDSNDAGPLLHAAAALVLEFSGLAPEIVVSVARKTDAQLWPALFQAVGPPSVLCEGLTASEVLDTAACALLIVDRMQGSAKARSLALRLVRRSLGSSDPSYRLVADLIKFLAPPSEGSLSPGSLKSQESEIASQSGNPETELGSRTSPGNEAPTKVGVWSWMWSVMTGSTNAGESGGDMKTSSASSLGVTRRLHAAASSSEIAGMAVGDDPRRGTQEVSQGVSMQAVQAWKTVGKHAWRLLDSGSLRELCKMQTAFGKLHGGLAALLSTTAGEVVFSLGHLTPSAPAIASALFLVSNEFSSALEGDVQMELAARELARALEIAGCINHSMAIVLVLGDLDVVRAFEAKNPQVWSVLVELVANDVHLCSFTSILTPTAP
jgi:WD40 repeat protein